MLSLIDMADSVAEISKNPVEINSMQYQGEVVLSVHSMRRLVRLPVCVLLLTACSHAAVAQWSFDPLIRAGGEYDDNATLDFRTDQEVVLRGVLLEAGADFAYDSQLTRFSFFPRVVSRNYSDNPEYDNNDIFLNARIERDTEFSTFGFRANYDSQTVRRAERADADIDIDNPDDIPGNESGRVAQTGNREMWRFLPAWSYRVSNVSSIAAEVDYFDVGYEDVLAGTLSDYTDARLSLSYQRTVSDLTSVVFLGTGRTYDSADENANEVNGYGLSLGFNRDLSQTTVLRAMVGVENTEQSLVADSTDIIGNVTLIRRLETISMLAQYRRSVNASGSGQLTLRDQINVNFDRRLTEKISAGVGITAYKNSDNVESSSSGAVDDRQYIQLRTRFIWFLTQAFTIEVEYDYTILDRGATVGEIANSNSARLWFGYRPNNPDVRR